MARRFRLNRALIQVSGPDSRDFLQGLITQDITRLDAEAALYGALLNPQGKIAADMVLWRAPAGDIVLDTDPSRSADLFRRLSLYKLRARVELQDLTANRGVAWSETPFEQAVVDPRMPDGSLGWRALTPRAELDALADGTAAYERVRIACGAPDLARDAAPEEVFALEGLLEELNGVDFRKGCFVGQENVSRMKRRATTRKKLCPITYEGPAPAQGTTVNAGESEIGTVRTGHEGRALAFVRLDRAQEALAKGERLTAGGRDIRLDPPGWLIQRTEQPQP